MVLLKKISSETFESDTHEYKLVGGVLVKQHLILKPDGYVPASVEHIRRLTADNPQLQLFDMQFMSGTEFYYAFEKNDLVVYALPSQTWSFDKREFSKMYWDMQGFRRFSVKPEVLEDIASRTGTDEIRKINISALRRAGVLREKSSSDVVWLWLSPNSNSNNYYLNLMRGDDNLSTAVEVAFGKSEVYRRTIAIINKKRHAVQCTFFSPEYIRSILPKNGSAIMTFASIDSDTNRLSAIGDGTVSAYHMLGMRPKRE